MGTPVLSRLSRGVKQTEAIAAELAGDLRGGECIALYGDLGAGKTHFVRGLVRGLGGSAHTVSSPTFVLLNVYDTGRLKVFHLDTYRTSSAEDLEAIGFTELLDQGGIVIVEWAERIEPILPPARIEVHLSATGKTSRRIEIARR